jgi:Leucine-rich repeat (LRR) protein
MKTDTLRISILLIVMSITLSGYSQTRLDNWNTQYKTYTSLKSAVTESQDSIIKLSLFAEKVDSWESVCKYKKLEGLELIDMFSENFPKCICELKELRFLSVRNNKLFTLPDEIANLKNLEFLNLYWNKNLNQLPRDLEKLTNLRNINIGGNPDLDLNKTLTLLAGLPALKSVTLSFNKIKVLPAEIGLLTQVEELILDNNLLKELPKEMSNMKSLKRIVLTNNNFTSIPKIISALPNIEEVDLANTYEEDLDKSLAGSYGHNKIVEDDVKALKQAKPNIKVTLKY